MESAIYYATIFPSPVSAPSPVAFSIIDKIQSLGSKYLLRRVGEYVLTDYIVKGVPLMKRWQKLHEKLTYYEELPLSYYIEKAVFHGYKSTPKCFKKNGKLYKKAKEFQMENMVEEIKMEITLKGDEYAYNLQEEWEELFPSISNKWLPPYERHTIYGTVTSMEYRLAFGDEWWSYPKTMRR